MKIRKYNLHEDRQLYAMLKEAPLQASEADKYPNYKPKESWEGSLPKKYEMLVKKLGAKPFPLPFGEKAAYELTVGNDRIWFYENGNAQATNTAKTLGYGALKKYPNAIVLFSETGKTGEKDPIEGYITVDAGGKPIWTPATPEESKKESNPYLDGLQLVLDIIGVVPGFGDIADIINAAISFARGNYFEGFLSIIGAIPVVGSAIAIPLKAALKGFSKAGDILKTAFKTGKSADEVWIGLKNSDKLDKRTMDMLVQGMGDVSDYVTKFRKEADFVLPDAAAKSLDEFAAFLRKQGDDAAAVFNKSAKASDEQVKALLRVQKELKTVDGLAKLLPRKTFRRLRNLFSSVLSPKELNALQGAMSMKFFKNMDNPGKLTTLIQTSADNEKITYMIGSNIGKYMDNVPSETFRKGWYSIAPGASEAKTLEKQLDFLKKNSPELYDDIKRGIIGHASKTNNPLYKEFMNNEINGLGSYLSPDYLQQAGISGAWQRWSNMVPVAYNELRDLGEDTLMTMGIEEQDDVNGFFWPLLKSALSAAEGLPLGVGDAIKGGEDWVTGGLQKAGEIKPVRAGAEWLAGKAGAGEKRTQKYDPNKQWTVVPTEDPRLQQQNIEKQQRIKQRKRFF
jgi:hypothetical protein